MPSDSDLLTRWRRGSPEAAQTLVQQHYPRMLNLFYRLTGTREQAEELTQDLFVRLTQQVIGDRPVDNLGAWLHTTALNLWRDQVRREITARNKGITTAGGDEEVEHVQAPDQVEAAVVAAWQQETVREAVLALGPRHREVVVLYYYQGLTYEEIARIAGIPVGTVRSRLHYAIAQLRTRLDLAEEEAGELSPNL